jgi:poly(A) polymerase
MQSPTYHPEGDVWEHTLRVLDAMRDPTPTLALGALLHDVGKPATRRVEGEKITFHGHPERGCGIAAAFLDRLRFPTRTRDIVLFLVEQHLRFLNVRQMKRSTLRRFLLQDHFDELLELYRLDRTGSSGDLTLWEFCKQELETLEKEAPPTRPLVSGDDLIALGHPPGPTIGRILHALVDAQLEGEVGDRDAALAWLRRHHAASPEEP